MPELAEILAAHSGSGYVVAPAGYGKTHLIAEATRLASTRQLVLTHTYAGASALRRKMRDLGVQTDRRRVDTIASWALRLCLAYPCTSGWDSQRPEGDEWTSLYRACAALLDRPFIRRILKASYGGMYVDEYQDCSTAQHQLVLRIARDLPCRILGDPLQTIFDFRGERPVDWYGEIPVKFECLGQLDTPHRWARAGQPELGAWLQVARSALEQGRPLDLTPPNAGITFFLATDEANLPSVQRTVCVRFACNQKDRVIAIHKGLHKAKCHRLAKETRGRFTSIEEIEGRDLFSFITKIERPSTPNVRLEELITFAAKCMTFVRDNLPAPTRRGQHTRIRSNTKNPVAARAANAYLDDPSSANMDDFLQILKALPRVRVARADLFNRMRGVLRTHLRHPDLTLRDAAEAVPN